LLTPDMDKYLNKVCADIVDNKTRWEVRAELEAHLEDKMERLIGDGLPENVAADKAIHEMGNPVELRQTLGQLHSRVPPFDMRSALTKLAFGVFFSTFSIDTWILRPITQAFGFFLIFMAIFQLRKCNFKLKIGFIIAIVNFIMRMATFAIGLTPSPGMTVSIILTVLANIIDCGMMYFIYVGLGELAEKYSTPGDVHPIRKYGIYNIILTAAVVIIIVMPPIAFLMLPMLVLYVIFAIKNINSVKNILIEADEGDNVCELRGFGRVLMAGLAVIFIAVPLGVAHIIVTPDVDAQPYMMSNENISIRAELDELRVEDELLEAIPDDELPNFEGAVKATNSFSNHELKRKGLVSVYCTSFAFEDKVILAELVDFDRMPKGRYTDSIYYTIYNFPNIFNIPEPDRLLMLYEADGETYFYEPINITYHEDGMRIKHIDFRLPENADDVRILKLSTLIPTEEYSDMQMNINTGLTYVNRSSLICWPYSETESDITYVSDKGVGYKRFNVVGLITTDGEAPKGSYSITSQDGMVYNYDEDGNLIFAHNGALAEQNGFKLYVE